jgi:cystathionine gamma-synthase
MRIETKLAQIGSTQETKTGAINFPIYPATAFRHPQLGESTGFDYIRTKSPTRSVLEEEFARLEKGDAGFAFASGMAAIQTVLSMFSQGDHLLVSVDLYGGTYRLLEKVLSRQGITASYVDTSDMMEIEGAFRANTKAIFIETPTNPQMKITNLLLICTWAKNKDIITIIDNTLMTPLYQRPIEYGADVVLHSATKYLGGHNDVLAGLVVTKGAEVTEQVAFLQNTIGAVLSPQDSWLLMRGMKTLALRMERHQSNALRLAEYLNSHPLVEVVYHPGLPEHPGHEVQKGQCFGETGIFSFKLIDSKLVEPVLRHIRLIAFAESLGGVESLMTFPAVQTHFDIPEEIRVKNGVDDRLLRFSVGIEHVDDLIEDLEQALQLAREEVDGHVEV